MHKTHFSLPSESTKIMWSLVWKKKLKSVVFLNALSLNRASLITEVFLTKMFVYWGLEAREARRQERHVDACVIQESPNLGETRSWYRCVADSCADVSALWGMSRVIYGFFRFLCDKYVEKVPLVPLLL